MYAGWKRISILPLFPVARGSLGARNGKGAAPIAIGREVSIRKDIESLDLEDRCCLSRNCPEHVVAYAFLGIRSPTFTQRIVSFFGESPSDRVQQLPNDARLRKHFICAPRLRGVSAGASHSRDNDHWDLSPLLVPPHLREKLDTVRAGDCESIGMTGRQARTRCCLDCTAIGGKKDPAANGSGKEIPAGGGKSNSVAAVGSVGLHRLSGRIGAEQNED